MSTENQNQENVESVFDGWEKQCFGHLSQQDSSGQFGFCALGHLGAKGIIKLDWKDKAGNCVADDPTVIRIANWIKRNWSFGPMQSMTTMPQVKPNTIITYANDLLKKTPADFRRADICSRAEELREELKNGQ